jgi:hypothetical protein
VTPALRSLAYLGAAPRAQGDAWVLLGQDGGQSIDLGEQLLFVFADTLLAERRADASGEFRAAAPLTRETGRFLGNCAALAPRAGLPEALAELRYFTGAGGWPREVLEPTPVERFAQVRLWPQHGVFAGECVYLFYLAIQHLGAGTWDFTEVGSGVARLDPRTGAAERVRRDGEWRLWAATGGLHAGVALLRTEDWLYVYSSRRAGTECRALVARVPAATPEALADPGAHEHLVGPQPRWSRVAEDFDVGPCGSEFSVSWNAHLRRYLMAYVNGYDKTLLLRTAAEPWGPWSAPIAAGVVPHDEASRIVSLGFEHPACARDGGRTVHVSYCQPRFAQNGLVAVTFA